MRTTVTLDRDVAVRLGEERRKRGQTLKELINSLLRAGLDAPHSRNTRRPFRTTGFDLGPSLIGSLDNVEEVLARAEGDTHR